MVRKESQLIVPVGQSAWEQLRDEDEYKDVFVFWEDYMGKIVPTIFSQILQSKPLDDEIDEIHFVYGKKVIKFETDFSVGWDMAGYKENGKMKSIQIFRFDLVGLSPNSKVGFFKKKKRKSAKNDNSSNKPTYSKGKRQDWVSIIYTPMGGMTKWRRR